MSPRRESRHPRGRGPTPFITHLSSLTIICSIFSSTMAQQGFQPTTAWGAASTFLEGQTLIIQGGSNGTFTIPQTFSIDLSTNWDTSSVPFRRLLDGPSDYKHSASLLNDHQNWFVLSNGTGLEYAITPDTWRSLGGSAVVSRTRGLGAATDPDSGMIYVPNGYLTNSSTQMFQYDLTNNMLNGLDMHPNLVNMVSYAIAWSGQEKKLILFGGATSGTNNVNGAMYSWDTVHGWTLLSPKGAVPSPRRSACMVPAYNGARMILFGGLTDKSNSVLSDIYILDTASMTWFKGEDAGVESARAECSCAMTNDLFVVWGGGGVNTVISSNLTIVYNARKDHWQSTFTPKADPDSSVPWASTAGAGGGGAGGKQIGVIAGASAAIVVVIVALVVGAVLYRRKRHHRRGSQDPQQLPDSDRDKDSPVTPPIQPSPDQQHQWQQQQQLPLHGLDQPDFEGYHDQQNRHVLHHQGSYSQLYTPYTPPILHDYYHEQQLYPRIFLPHQQATPILTHQPMQPRLLDELARHDDPSRQASVSSTFYYSPTDESPPASSELSNSGTDPTAKGPTTPTVYRPPPSSPQGLSSGEHDGKRHPHALSKDYSQE